MGKLKLIENDNKDNFIRGRSIVNKRRNLREKKINKVYSMNFLLFIYFIDFYLD